MRFSIRKTRPLYLALGAAVGLATCILGLTALSQPIEAAGCTSSCILNFSTPTFVGIGDTCDEALSDLAGGRKWGPYNRRNSQECSMGSCGRNLVIDSPCAWQPGNWYKITGHRDYYCYICDIASF